jgi:hypothetical protein
MNRDEIDPFVWSTIILGIWAAVGPLVGVRYGHDLSKRWQKEHWLANNRKEEYREVLQALSAAIGPMVQFGAPGSTANLEELKAATSAENAAYAILETRLFIKNELETLGVYGRWKALASKFSKDKNVQEFSEGYKTLTEDIRKAALGSAGGAL